MWQLGRRKHGYSSGQLYALVFGNFRRPFPHYNRHAQCELDYARYNLRGTIETIALLSRSNFYDDIQNYCYTGAPDIMTGEVVAPPKYLRMARSGEELNDGLESLLQEWCAI